MMDLNALRFFRVAARLGSMSAAARELHVSQPSLTVAIQKLERHLRTQLFIRDTKGVSLTSSGQALLNSSQELLALIQRTEREILGLEEEDVGRFTLGCHESLGGYFLPAFLRDFLPKAPRIDIRFFHASSAGVRTAVIDRKVDFGLAVNPEPHPDLVMTPLFRDGVEAFVARTEPEQNTVEAARARIQRGPLIYAERVHQCRDIISRLHVDGLMPQRYLSCGDLEMVKALVLEGLGVALLPRRVALSRDGHQLRPLHPQLPNYPDTIYLLYRGDLHRTSGALRVKDALLQHGRRLSESDPPKPSTKPSS